MLVFTGSQAQVNLQGLIQENNLGVELSWRVWGDDLNTSSETYVQTDERKYKLTNLRMNSRR